jgi:3-phosphoglycerate kinase
MIKKLLRDISPQTLTGRTVLVRVDYNVPLDSLCQVTDLSRVERTLPTLKYLVSAGARIVLISHLGRPGGKRNPKLSLNPIVEHLDRLLGQKIHFCPETVGPKARKAVADLRNGGIVILENTRFHPEETEGDVVWANEIRHDAGIFVNDAFGMAHRSHASTTGVSAAIRRCGGLSVAGFLMEREIAVLSKVLSEPVRPFVGVLGGAKISGKIDLIEALLQRVDSLLIGGAMANTFFVAMGHNVGRSLVEENFVEFAKDLLKEFGEKLLLPVDVMTAEVIVSGISPELKEIEEITQLDRVVDIGHRTIQMFSDVIMRSGTLIWNGPMGVFEVPSFATGTFRLAEVAAHAAKEGSCVILGGGDSSAAAKAAGVLEEMTHVSTGGGATLELLSGKTLPGFEALSNEQERK